MTPAIRASTSAAPAAGRPFLTLAVAGLLALLAGPSPLAVRLAAASLPAHMLLEHTVLLGSGVLVAAALWRLAGRALGPGRLGAIALTAAAMAIVVWWHLPLAFDAAIMSSTLHAVMHLSYVAAGFLLALAVPQLGPFDRVMVLLAGQAVMGVLALALLTGAIAYVFYPASDSVASGVAMFAVMQLVYPGLILVPRATAALRGSVKVAYIRQ